MLGSAEVYDRRVVRSMVDVVHLEGPAKGLGFTPVEAADVKLFC